MIASCALAPYSSATKKMDYELFLGTKKFGRVTEGDVNFPNLWGNLELDEWVTTPKSEADKQLARFVELNCESTRLVDRGDNDDLVDAELAAVNAKLEDFNRLVESDDWALVDDTGRRHEILCPILRYDGEIVWRWRP